jgi:hypothetical protein
VALINADLNAEWLQEAVAEFKAELRDRPPLNVYSPFVDRLREPSPILRSSQGEPRD